MKQSESLLLNFVLDSTPVEKTNFIKKLLNSIDTLSEELGKAKIDLDEAKKQILNFQENGLADPLEIDCGEFKKEDPNIPINEVSLFEMPSIGKYSKFSMVKGELKYKYGPENKHLEKLVKKQKRDKKGRYLKG